jgi:hypothetical protein
MPAVWPSRPHGAGAAAGRIMSALYPFFSPSSIYLIIAQQRDRIFRDGPLGNRTYENRKKVLIFWIPPIFTL